MHNNELEKDRQQIDQLDLNILKLLNHRAELSLNIARIKLHNNMPVFVPERENRLLEHIISTNTGPLDAEAIRSIFMSIMEESKRLQQTILNQNVDKNKNNDSE